MEKARKKCKALKKALRAVKTAGDKKLIKAARRAWRRSKEAVAKLEANGAARAQDVAAVESGKRPRTRSLSVDLTARARTRSMSVDKSKTPKKKQKKEQKKKKKKEKKEKKEPAKSPDTPEATEMSEADKYRKEHEITVTSGSKRAKIPDPFRSFAEAPFSESVQAALKATGFKEPSPIQAQGWPIALSGVDVVGVAKTGSGKTLGFLLPMVHAISSQQLTGAAATAPAALILTPTRELALQIEKQFLKFCGGSSSANAAICGIRCVCVYGGASKGLQIRALKTLKPRIIIATPGRMNDLLDNCTPPVTTLNYVKHLVLDEADRMLDMGFEPQIKKIIKQTQPGRQTLFFTATWPKAVHKMALRYLRKGAEIVHVTIGSMEELVANKSVSQEFFELDDSEKDEKLWRIIKDCKEGTMKMIVFANTKRRIDHLSNAYWKDGFGASAIHGGKTQPEREEALEHFATGKWPLMFATDVASRGLDIPGVTHVVNFDMPRDVDSYIHRIGRTGRAGLKGASITFWNKSYDIPCAPALAKIAREAGQVVPPWLERWAQRGKAKKNWKY